jgi:phosphate-selective porin OprO and OprP
VSLSIFALISILLLNPPPEAPEEIATPTSREQPEEPVSDTPVSQDPKLAPIEPASTEPEVSPLVPRSQIEFLSGHPVDLARAQFRPGKGLTIASTSNRFSLTIGARVQLLYTLAHDNDPAAEPAVEHSFQIRRARILFNGHMFGEHNKFKIELSISPRDVGLQAGGTRFTILRDYYLEFDHLRDLTVRVGQYKVPYSLQRVISSGRLQLNDRSIVGPEFDFDRDIGLDLRSNDFLGLDRLRYYAGVFFGGGRDNFTPEPILRDGGLVYLTRVEVLPFGRFDDYVEGDFDRTSKPRLALGGAYSYMDDASFNRGTKGSRPTDEGTTDYHNVNASVAFKIVGLSLLGEFFWRRGVRRPGDATIEDALGNLVPAPIEAPRNGLGWYTQLGFMIPHAPVEIAARYSQIRAIGSAAETSMLDNNELGGGLSWYVAGHPFKLQADYFRLWQDDIGRGLDQFRVQLQLSF